MTTPDVNVLVAAFRPDHPHHTVAQPWLARELEACARGGTLELLPMVAVGFVRVVTSRRIFSVPTRPEQALAFLRAVTVLGGAAMPSLGHEWDTFEKLCVELELTGAIVSDAWIAAAVLTGGLHLVTFDSDFARLLPASQFTLLPRASGVGEPWASYEVLRQAA